jgi:hypothetical protein
VGSSPTPGTTVGGVGQPDGVPHVRPQSTVDSALRASDAGMRDADNAALHGVTIKTIRRWRRDYQRRGKARGQSHCAASCPRCEEAALDERAYAELLGWYLGDGHISLGRRGVYSLHVFNDATYVEDNAHLLELCRRVKPGSRPHTRLKAGCVITTVGWKHWPCLFPQHGPGRKHERMIALEPWQRSILKAHPGPFLRGLFHSDGSRTRNWATRVVRGEQRRYEYPRWEFANRSDDILGLCRWALDLVAIPHRMRTPYRLAVSRREAVARLDALIGPKR